MANISITNPSISNSETSDVTKLTANDNDIINGLTDGTKDLSIGALTVAGALTTSGGITTDATGDDIKSVAWTDWSASASPQGGTAFTTSVWYKKIGKSVFVKYSINGTSNAATFSFTVPYASHATAGSTYAAVAGLQDNTTYETGGYVSLDQSSSSASIFRYNAASFTSSGVKYAFGEFFYEAAS